MRLSLVTHLCLLLRGTVSTRRAGIIVRNESMWVSSHLVLTWNLRKTCHMDTLGKPCSSCQPFCLHHALLFLFPVLMAFTPFPGDSFAISSCCLCSVCSRVPADYLSSRKARVGEKWWVVRTKGLSGEECTSQGGFLVQTVEILGPQKV